MLGYSFFENRNHYTTNIFREKLMGLFKHLTSYVIYLCNKITERLDERLGKRKKRILMSNITRIRENKSGLMCNES